MTILVPFHQDEQLADENLPTPTGPVRRVAPTLGSGSQWDRVRQLFGALADEVAAQVAEGGTVKVLTGDCLAAAGTLAGLQRAGVNPSVVWFDAHADLHTLATSTSGYIGGTSLRVLIGGDRDKLGEPLGLRPVPESHCLLVGARDIDPAEQDYLRSSEVRPVAVAGLTVADLPPGPLLVHVDLDVVDGAEVPGLRFPVSGGPAPEQTLQALSLILGTGRVAALEIACPWHDPAGPAQAAARTALVEQLLAQA